MTNFAPRLMVLFLCGTALAGCSSTPDIAAATGGQTAAEHAKAEIANITKTLPADLDSGVRQAQLLRQAGHYDEAVHMLSQLMLVASDDPRVVSEYGKTLAEMGRAQDATQFLNRAVQLQPNDWTSYSALGVAYDQLGDQVSARVAYEHALLLHPGEPSVLNNYSLSRMLAGDPEGARALIDRARLGGGETDPKIARNIALVNELAPAPDVQQVAKSYAAAVQKAVPVQTIAAAPLPAIAVPPRNAAAAPRPLQAPQPKIQPPPQPRLAQQQYQPAMEEIPLPQLQQQPVQTVVMQAVPFDPYAGPVQPRIQLHMPKKIAKAAVPASDATPAPKPDSKPVAKAPIKTADAKPKAGVPALRMAADKY